MGKKSHLSVENELLIHKAVSKSIWSYGIQIFLKKVQQACILLKPYD